MWAFLGPLLYLTALSGTLIYVFKKRFNFQFLLPVAIIFATLFVYFFTFLFHHISIGIIITVLVALAFVPLVIRDKDRKKTIKQLLLTPGFLIFVILYTLLFAFHYTTIPQLFSDDNMHWAPHVWTMWLRDDFYTSPGLSIVTHGDYPPILQLFQLMFVKVAGMYKEGLLYVALEITSFAMLFPLLKNLEWKKGRSGKTIGLSTLILLAFIALPATLDVTHLFYNALHPDYAIAFVFLFTLYIAVTQSHVFSWTSAIILSVAISFLCLTKQASVLFGGLAGLVYFACLWHSYRPKVKVFLNRTLNYLKAWRKHWMPIVLALVLLLLPLVTLKAWSEQIKGFKAPYCCVAIFHVSPTDVLKVPDVLLKHTGDASQQHYARDFFRYVLTYQAGITTQFLSSVSYMQFTVLFIGIMVFIGYNYKDKFRRSKLAIVASIVVAGWFVYLLAIYLTFLFGGMIDSERDNLLTGDRYLRTYIFSMLLILFALFIGYIVKRFNDNKKNMNRALLIFGLVLVVVGGLIFNVDIIKNGYLVESVKFKSEYVAASITNPDELASHIRAFTKSVNSDFSRPKNIAVTEKGSGNDTSYYLRYLAIPNHVPNGSSIVIDKNTSQKQLCNTLKSDDYLFIDHAYNDSKSLALVNNCLTDKVTSFNQYEAFRIEKDGDSLRLVQLHY